MPKDKKGLQQGTYLERKVCKLTVCDNGNDCLGPTGPRGRRGVDGLTGSTGATGEQGPAGQDGSFGGASFDYLFSSDTQDTDPGVGYVKINDILQLSSSFMYIDSENSDGANIDNFMEIIKICG